MVAPFVAPNDNPKAMAQHSFCVFGSGNSIDEESSGQQRIWTLGKVILGRRGG